MQRRILLLVTDLHIGGTPTVVREIAIRLSREKGVSVHVACLAAMGPVGKQIAAQNIPVTALAAAGPTDFAAILRLRRLLRIQQFDTIFSFLIHANFAASVASWKLPKRPRLIQSIQTAQPYPRWHWKLQHLIQNSAERIVVPSDSVAQVAAKWAEIPLNKIVTIPNAIEPSDFASAAQEQINYASSPTRIGFIGRLDPIKRISDLIDAMLLLPRATTLDIFGQGPQLQSLTAQILRLDLHSRVKMHGAIDSPQTALSQIDVLILPSEAEGFGLVLLEAMAAGVPVIGTNVAGIRDVIVHSQNGLLVPPRNSGALAGAIRKIFNDNELRNHLIAGGHAAAMNQFSWQSVWPKYRKLLNLA